MNEKNVLLLAESDSSAQLDRRALREAGFPRVKMVNSGLEAARALADGLDVDFAVCAQRLTDMDGERFVDIIRQHPRLLAFPVLLILGNESEAEQLRALGCGASALLGRPYSVQRLQKQINGMTRDAPSMRRLKEASAQTDTSAFDAALATYGILLKPDREPDNYFNVGMNCLQARDWNTAISAFQLALSGAKIKAEAELGMAAAYKGKGDLKNFRAWLAKGAKTLVAARRWHLARTAYARLLKYEPGAKNPFISRAHQLIRELNYKEAARVLTEGFSTVKDANPKDRFARLCFSAPNPEAMLRELEENLAGDRGDIGENFGREIRETIKTLEKERDQRARQRAVERKWELSRKFAEMKKAEASPKESGSRLDAAPVVERAVEPANFAPEEEETAHSGLETELPDESEAPVPAPLFQGAPPAKIFGKPTKFNELLSVMKLTWKLARLSEKKKS